MVFGETSIKMEPKDFKCWIENCVRDAKVKGMTEDDNLVELMEQVKIMLVKKEIDILGSRK